MTRDVVGAGADLDGSALAVLVEACLKQTLPLFSCCRDGEDGSATGSLDGCPWDSGILYPLQNAVNSVLCWRQQLAGISR